jgi:photosystem II stability/assembly factor-like uncharacterized protein
MALFYPDILEHNNPNNPLLNDDQLWGGMQVVDDKTARNSIPLNKRKIGSTVSYLELTVVTIQKYVGPDTTDLQWTNDLNWQNIQFPFIEQNIVKVLLSNATTVVPIGDKTLYTSFVIRYQMIRDTVMAMGTIEVMHNSAALETPVDFDIREFNGLMGLVDITSAFNGNEIELSFEIDNSIASDVVMVYDIQRKQLIHVPVWVEQTSPAANGLLEAVSFADANNGWAAGRDNSFNIVIINTTDGGANWTQQTSPLISGEILGLSFVDANTGWAVGNDAISSNVILKTIDGGAHWVQQIPLVVVLTLNGVHFLNANVGWAVGSDGTNNIIINTTDGGTNWAQQTSPVITGVLYSVHFIDANNGWIVGDNSGVIIIFNTVDGGVNWTQQTSPVASTSLRSVYFVDLNNGWAVGSDGSNNILILHTADGGANWVRQTSPVTTGFLLAVNFIDANNGWAVGNDGAGDVVILNTINGGATWVRQVSPVIQEGLLAVDFINANLGYAVGAKLGGTSDLILKYS